MRDKLKNRFHYRPAEPTELRQRISERVGGGVISIVDTDIVLSSVSSGETPEELAKPPAGFHVGEHALNAARLLDTREE